MGCQPVVDFLSDVCIHSRNNNNNTIARKENWPHSSDGRSSAFRFDDLKIEPRAWDVTVFVANKCSPYLFWYRNTVEYHLLAKGRTLLVGREKIDNYYAFVFY